MFTFDLSTNIYAQKCKVFELSAIFYFSRACEKMVVAISGLPVSQIDLRRQNLTQTVLVYY